MKIENFNKVLKNFSFDLIEKIGMKMFFVEGGFNRFSLCNFTFSQSQFS